MKAPDISSAERDFGFAPMTFNEGLQKTFGVINDEVAEAMRAAPAHEGRN
jgi:hypothetical protein